jgi:hypothetical protein
VKKTSGFVKEEIMELIPPEIRFANNVIKNGSLTDTQLLVRKSVIFQFKYFQKFSASKFHYPSGSRRKLGWDLVYRAIH